MICCWRFISLISLSFLGAEDILEVNLFSWILASFNEILSEERELRRL